MAEVIKEGDYVVLEKSFDTGNMKIISVKRGSSIHYGKLHFDPSPLIGSHFGSIYEIKDDTMVKVEDFEEYNNELSGIVSSKLQTFNEKSQFSQEKILKKKKQKSHSNIVTVIRPTLLLVNEMLYARDKIAGLRSDTLGQILTLSNVQNGSRCLLLDHNLGILTSAVMSRILPDGVLIQLVPDNEVIQTTRKTMNMLNIREADCQSNLFAVTVRDLYKIHKGVDFFEYENEILKARGADHVQRLSDHIKRGTDGNGEAALEEADILIKEQLQQTLLRKDSNRETRNRERIGASKHLKAGFLDSLILVVQHDHPLPLLKLAYPFLAPSGQFVIYSDTVEPLLECHQHLRTNSLAVSLSMSESWLRKHQVLPDRTRPEMNASGYGGYLMSGTKATYGESQCSGDGRA